METVYDWVTIAIFAGLIVLFLQRSVGQERDHAWPYFAAAVACAVVNQVGNYALKNGALLWHMLAVGGIVAILCFIHYTLRPFGRTKD